MSTEFKSLIGQKIPVLDDGFVMVVNSMGDDDAVVNAARLTVKNLKPYNDNKNLIRYLMRHRHTTPFEFCELVLHVRVPMDTWRQWVRHRTASINEMSTRYSEAIDSMAVTHPTAWRVQSENNRQGSSGYLSEKMGLYLSRDEEQHHRAAEALYKKRLKKGVAREQARKDLPLSNYTEAFWKCNLHNLFHFLSLRMDSHAQEEIRSYANVIGNEIVARWVPNSWEAFQDYRLNAVTLSARDIEVLNALITWDERFGRKIALKFGWVLDGDLEDNPKSRELKEFKEKLKKLGFDSYWK